MMSTKDHITMNVARTPAAKAREKILLKDPHANLLNSEWVECRICGKNIKLSLKSAFDTHHWRNHRARCLKALKQQNKMRQKALRSVVVNKKGVAASPGRLSTAEPRSSRTPSLTDNSDSEEGRESPNSYSPRSPQSPPSPPPPQAQTLLLSHDSPLFGDYLHRFHPGYLQRPIFDNWHDWSWSQLKAASFEVQPRRVGSEDDDHDGGGIVYQHRPTLVEPRKRDHEAAHALSMLSHS